MSKYTEDDLKIELETKEYEYGFYTDLESETFPVGLNEDIVRAISKKKEEPEWMTDWRIEAFRAWQEMTEPNWANVQYDKPDFQAISYYSAPKQSRSEERRVGKEFRSWRLSETKNRKGRRIQCEV